MSDVYSVFARKRGNGYVYYPFLAVISILFGFFALLMLISVECYDGVYVYVVDVLSFDCPRVFYCPLGNMLPVSVIITASWLRGHWIEIHSFGNGLLGSSS
jgi:hypothetical protein